MNYNRGDLVYVNIQDDPNENLFAHVNGRCGIILKPGCNPHSYEVLVGDERLTIHDIWLMQA